MAWYHKENNACGSTSQMMDELYDWVTKDTGSDFPLARKFTAGLRGVTPASPSSFVLPGATDSRFASPSTATLVKERQRLYRISRGGVDYWFLLDMAYTGGAVNAPNLGIFNWLTTNTGVAADDFAALVTGADDPSAATVTTPYAASCYPTHGASAYHFFSDGEAVHVAFKRTSPSASSWQHFSFGMVTKPSGATWVGGEYFSGCCAPADITKWDYLSSTALGSGKAQIVLSANGSLSYNSATASSEDPLRMGHIRVVGAKLPVSPFTATNFCCLGGSPVGTVTLGAGKVGFTHIMGAASSTTLGGTSPAIGTKSLAPLGVGTNSWNGRSVGFGPSLFYYDGEVTQRLQYLGNVPGIRFIQMDNIAENQTLNQDWLAFPLHNKTTLNAVHNESGHMRSGNLGIAYKMP